MDNGYLTLHLIFLLLRRNLFLPYSRWKGNERFENEINVVLYLHE